MQALAILAALGLNDIRNVRRDALLGWMFLLPLLYVAMARWLVPLIDGNIAFDLSPYYGLIMALVGLATPSMLFGVIIGFMLLDEKDDRTLIAMRVTPLPILGYILSLIHI
ncbi:MAG: hypothetical protein GYB68_16765, partial [Chloroflexi bacterium]|nr:hypothetical protein [Chloroflexota bacterium]